MQLRSWLSALLLLALLDAAPAVAAPETKTTTAPAAVPPPLVSLGGATRMNMGFFDQDAGTRARVAEADDGVAFRTTRLWAKGQLAPDIGFQTELDFAQPGRPSFQNAYLELQNLPGHHVLRLGRWKQPFSLETQTSIRFLTFIERATLFTFVPFRRTGVGLLGSSGDGRATWGLSAHRAGDDQFGDDVGQPGGFALSARGTRLLLDSADGSRLLHVGAGYHRNDPVGDRVRYAAGPEFVLGSAPRGNTPFFADTGDLVADDHEVWGGEVAWVHGAVSVQAEYARASADRLVAPEVRFGAGYAFVSWFLGGEHRVYSRTLGAFDRPHVPRPFRARSGEGAGAWEVTARVSFLDLEDQDIRGRTLDDVTVGLNWHLDDHARILFNHVRAHLEDGGASVGRTAIWAVQAVYDF